MRVGLRRVIVQSQPGSLAFGKRGYYDVNVWSERKRVEKLRDIHRIR